MNSTENEEFEDAFLAYLKDGSPESLKNFFNKSHQFIGQLCYRFFKDPADVEDVMQIFYIKIYENRDKLCKKLEANDLLIIPWCIKTVLNTAKREYNREKAIQLRKKKAMNTQNDTAQEKDHDAEKNALKNALSSLPEKYRIPIYLKYYEEQSYEAISASLGVNQSTLRSILQRGLEKLRGAVKLTTGIVLTDLALIRKLQASEFETINPEAVSGVFNNLSEASIHASQITNKISIKSAFAFKSIAIGSITAVTIITSSYFVMAEKQLVEPIPITTTNQNEENITRHSFIWNASQGIEPIKPLANFDLQADQNGKIILTKGSKKQEIIFPFLRTSEYSYMKLTFWLESGEFEISSGTSVLPNEMELNKHLTKKIITTKLNKGKHTCEIVRHNEYSIMLLNGKVTAISKLLHKEKGMLTTKYDVAHFNITGTIKLESIEYYFNKEEKHKIINTIDELWESKEFTPVK